MADVVARKGSINKSQAMGKFTLGGVFSFEINGYWSRLESRQSSCFV
jgi:hypothetical protein